MVRLITVVVALVLVGAPSALAASPKLSATYPNAPTAGQAFVVIAKVKPAKKNVKLSLQQKLAGKWKTLASGKTNAKGMATISATLAAGKSTLRLSGKVGSKTASSPARVLTVTAGGGGGSGGGGGGTGPLFTPPGRDLTGPEAAQAILPYLGNSTFTDCVAGWPNCAVESRYGFFASGEMFYCRLTNSTGSDIINAGHPYQIIGAEMKADGSWNVDLQVTSYGNELTYYEWRVATTGQAVGAYWGPGHSIYNFPGNPTSYTDTLQWVRGARNCSY